MTDKRRYFGGIVPTALEEQIAHKERERFYGRLHPWIFNRTVQEELQWRIQRQMIRAMKGKSAEKIHRRIRGFDMNTAAGREAAKRYRIRKYRIKKGLISGEPALQQLINVNFAECQFTISYQR